ncbi:RelA/SpoT domain-containing protein [Spirochaeta cellobiosiphila]|uniref:RelA/SpoT domain-containing protein n=1 Tax=Spirochaeta cellobiosiphila TaxID=504483 RepID=UPI00040E9229|nr:RelA/SpoT domain-containing protein [Spirochaeta cellobiosiphila]
MQQDFFKKFNINPLKFDQSGLKWEDLLAISTHYDTIKPDLAAVGKFAVESILKCKNVHSINYRVKDNEHLIEKIIRKTIADPCRRIRIDNYQEQITDLVGVRALHLFKEDWSAIHEFMMDSWNLAEPPKAYVRHGDSPRIIEYYKEKDCEVEEHPFGYRSVHYLIEAGLGKEKLKVEVQVRTIFEEAWGEIDHVVRYPYHKDKDMLVRLSSILNRLAGDADELGTYMRYFKTYNDQVEASHQQEIESKNQIIDSLRQQINQLTLDENQLQSLTNSLDALEGTKQNIKKPKQEYLWLDSFMDSPLFKNLSHQLEKIVQSEGFQPIEVSEEDFAIMENAQKELFQILGNPEKLNRFLSDGHVKNLMNQIEFVEPKKS